MHQLAATEVIVRLSDGTKARVPLQHLRHGRVSIYKASGHAGTATSSNTAAVDSQSHSGGGSSGTLPSNARRPAGRTSSTASATQGAPGVPRTQASLPAARTVPSGVSLSSAPRVSVGMQLIPARPGRALPPMARAPTAATGSPHMGVSAAQSAAASDVIPALDAMVAAAASIPEEGTVQHQAALAPSASTDALQSVSGNSTGEGQEASEAVNGTHAMQQTPENAEAAGEANPSSSPTADF
jgi:hypothetical protein